MAFLTNIFWCLPTPQPHLMLASLTSTKCQPHWPLQLLHPPPSLTSGPLHTPFLLPEMLLCGSLQGYFFSSFGSLGYLLRKAFHNHANEVPLLFSITAFCSCNYQFAYFWGALSVFPCCTTKTMPIFHLLFSLRWADDLEEIIRYRFIYIKQGGKI